MREAFTAYIAVMEEGQQHSQFLGCGCGTHFATVNCASLSTGLTMHVCAALLKNSLNSCKEMLLVVGVVGESGVNCVTSIDSSVGLMIGINFHFYFETLSFSTLVLGTACIFEIKLCPSIRIVCTLLDGKTLLCLLY